MLQDLGVLLQLAEVACAPVHDMQTRYNNNNVDSKNKHTYSNLVNHETCERYCIADALQSMLHPCSHYACTAGHSCVLDGGEGGGCCKGGVWG